MNAIRLSWPALRAALESHTVQTDRGLVAGFLVRCTSSRKELGYVWQAGSSWRWKSPEGFGERSTLKAAVEVVREAHDVRQGAGLPLPEAWRHPVLLRPTPVAEARPAPRPAPRPDPKPEPAPEPEPQIVWPDEASAPDLMSAIAERMAQFRRK